MPPAWIVDFYATKVEFATQRTNAQGRKGETSTEVVREIKREEGACGEIGNESERGNSRGNFRERN